MTFALGSETSGSIITPSAYCGVTGLRPTYGLVSRRGAMSLAWTLDKIGPMCRSAEDCGLVLHVIAGADAEDPGSARKGFAYVPQFDRKITDITIGYAPVDFERAAPEAQAAFKAALDVMKNLGAKFKEVEIPDFPYQALVETVIGARGGLHLRGFHSRPKNRPDGRSVAGGDLEVGARYFRRQLSEGHAHPFSGAFSVPRNVL